MQLEIDRITIDVDRNQTLPKLDMTFQYAYSGSAPESKAAWEMMFDRELNSLVAGLSLRCRFWEIGRQGQVTSITPAEIPDSGDASLLEQAVREEVHNAADAAESSLGSRSCLIGWLFRLQKTYEEEKQQFSLGVRTSTDVLIAK